ncbi:hypothetical protein XFF6994_650005 [Xanthomonas citri pv. fuscans]|nr:hypothetical protein XFF6994_650005 [Xanthomonas citri pv. fuscans]
MRAGHCTRAKCVPRMVCNGCAHGDCLRFKGRARILGSDMTTRVGRLLAQWTPENEKTAFGEAVFSSLGWRDKTSQWASQIAPS